MTIRRSLLALTAVAVLGVAACSSGSSGSPAASPSLAVPTPTMSTAPASPMPSASGPASAPPAAGSPAASTGAVAGATSVSGKAGFCADFQAQFAATWPKVDATTATTLVTKLQQWANDAESSDIQVDAATILGWLSTAAVSGSLASPPPDVVQAMTHIKTFAETNC